MQNDWREGTGQPATCLLPPAGQVYYCGSAPRKIVNPPGGLWRATLADVDRANCVITLKGHKTARKTGQVRRIPSGRKLGHANISTTRRCMHLDDRELAEAQDLVE